jgi:uncharacterized protein (TIRG00374 family)
VIRFLKVATLVGGLGLFVWLLVDADIAAVTDNLSRIGWFGAVAIFLSFFVSFASDVASWLLMFRTIVVNAVWAWRLWLVQMVGEALNVVTPFGSLGGEPFKALLLKRHYDVSYREGTASLLLIQTVNSLAMTPFIIVGALLMLGRNIVSPAIESAMLIAALWIAAFMLMVFVALHMRWLAALQQRLGQSRWAERLGRGLHVIGDIEEHLFTFVRHTPLRFSWSFLFAFLNWLFGAIEMFMIFWFLGQPITFAEAWMIEAAVVLVRAATFFIPGHIGVQDGAITLIGTALTGSPDIGLAVALVRRGRELAWTGVGLAIGGWYGLKEPRVTA